MMFSQMLLVRFSVIPPLDYSLGYRVHEMSGGNSEFKHDIYSNAKSQKLILILLTFPIINKSSLKYETMSYLQ